MPSCEERSHHFLRPANLDGHTPIDVLSMRPILTRWDASSVPQLPNGRASGCPTTEKGRRRCRHGRPRRAGPLYSSPALVCLR